MRTELFQPWPDISHDFLNRFMESTQLFVGDFATLKATVEKALENGEFSSAQIAQIKSILWADGKVTYEELRTLHETIKEVMGDVQPGLEWLSSH